MQSTTGKLEMTEVTPGCLLLRCSGGLSWEDRTLLADRVERFFSGGGDGAHSGQQRCCRAVVFDLSGVSYINSAGMGALFQLAQRVRRLNARLALAAAPTAFLRMFRMAGLDRLVTLHGSTAEALHEFADRASGPWGLAGDGGESSQERPA